jgi:hypothetical protein
VTDDTRLEALFERYRLAVEAGQDPDMAALLDEAGDKRDDLAKILEHYHSSVPAKVDLQQVDALAASDAFAPAFGEVLSAARESRGMLRRVLVERLVAALGFSDALRPRVDQRLHELEAGLRPARGVSPRVLDALDAILGGVGSALRASRDLPGAPAGGPAAVFQRLPSGEAKPDLAQPAEPGAQADEAELAEVDRLFGVSD